ncbi:MAG: T9SS type A sorting domain-containing protein [Cytophagales bacterium]|nr:T9SS type A sorting domain-containing protein [Cytophagales bacterium]
MSNNMTLRNCVLGVLLFSTFIGFSQEQYTFNSLGGSGSTNNVQMSFSVGGVINASYTTSDQVVNQGFIQTFSTKPILSSDPSQKEGVEIFPNPVIEILNIQLQNTQFNTYEILDSKGAILYSEQASTTITEINVQHLPQGVYTIRLIGSENIVLEKFIKL